MRLFLLLVGVLILQELATTNVVLLTAHHAGYSIAFITTIFIVTTAFDLFAGFWLGKWVQRRLAGHKVVKKSEEWARRFERYLGAASERVTLILLGFVSYVYVNAFLASWLSFPTAEIMLCLALGDLLWYAFEWGIVLGAESLSQNLATELYLIVGISILFIVGVRFFALKLFREE